MKNKRLTTMLERTNSMSSLTSVVWYDTTSEQDHFGLQAIDAQSVNPYDLFTNNWYSQKLKEKNNNPNKDFEIYDGVRSSKFERQMDIL